MTLLTVQRTPLTAALRRSFSSFRPTGKRLLATGRNESTANSNGKPGEPSKLYSQFNKQQPQQRHTPAARRSSSKRKKRQKPSIHIIRHKDFLTQPQQRLLYHNPNYNKYGSAASVTQEHQLPTLNASPLLDKQSYDSPKRLASNRNAFLQVMDVELLWRRSTSYALTGHGVPPQLLQEHVNMASALLESSEGGVECSFHNRLGKLSFDWMRQRSASGTNRAIPWPISSSLTNQMELYLTVMKRLASNLGVVLYRQAKRGGGKTGQQSKVQAQSRSKQRLATPPNHWNVDIVRGKASHSNNIDTSPSIVVEWMPRDGISAPGHVCIRLQGYADDAGGVEGKKSLRRRRPVPISLHFDACFRGGST